MNRVEEKFLEVLETMTNRVSNPQKITHVNSLISHVPNEHKTFVAHFSDCSMAVTLTQNDENTQQRGKNGRF